MSIGEIFVIVGGSITSLGTITALVVKLISTSKMKRFAEAMNILQRKMMTYMEMAEEHLPRMNGPQKKAWVIGKVKAHSETIGYHINGDCHGYWIDTTMVSGWLENSISFSKKVNK